MVDNPSMPPLKPSLRRIDSPRSAIGHSHGTANASKRKAAESAHDAQCDEAFWKSWRENRASRPQLTAPAVSGAERIEAIKRRLHNAV